MATQPSTAREQALWRDIAQNSVSINDGALLRDGQGGFHIVTACDQRDLERSTTRAFTRTATFTTDAQGKGQVHHNPFPTDGVAKLTSVSPSGKMMVCVREDKDKKQFIELWDRYRLRWSASLASTHGKVASDANFGCMAWSPDETRVVYAAVPTPEKSVSFLEPLPTENKDKAPRRGTQFDFVEDWGEGLTGVTEPALYILPIGHAPPEKTTKVDGLPEKTSCGGAVWTPDGKGLVFVSYAQQPRRLGLTYCTNRRSKIYLVTEGAEGKFGSRVDLFPGLEAVRAPRFSPAGDKLVCMSTLDLQTHNSAATLVYLEWSGNNVSATRAVPTSGDLYLTGLRQHCFLDNRTILASGYRRSYGVVFRINIETGEVSTLDVPMAGRVSFLDAVDNTILVSWSNPAVPDSLLIGRVNGAAVDWTPASPPTDFHTAPADTLITWQVEQVRPTVPTKGLPEGAEQHAPFEIIWTQPPQSVVPTGTKAPLIMMPHGGPHSVWTAEFFGSVAFFNLLGYHCALINFRGSLGYDEKTLRSLVGTAGYQDVADVHDATTHMLNKDSIDPTRVAMVGGSHGGFLTGHSIGQHPTVYRAAILRNPVINMASMVTTSDIPDWCYAQIDLPFGTPYSPEMLSKLFLASPIAHVTAVRTPAVIMLGEDDRRVPPSQGVEFYNTLRARDVPVRLLSYPENGHPIIKVDSEMDAWINASLWFREHMA